MEPERGTQMFEHPLDDVYRMIELTEMALHRLRSTTSRKVDAEDYWEITEVVNELLGWTNTAYVENDIGVEPSLLSKFVKMRGKVDRHLAIKIAERIRSYLKSQDQASDTAPNTRELPKAPPPKQERPVVFAGEQWVLVRHTSDVKQKIGAIAALLDSIIEQTGHSNAPDEEQILTDIERKQLIAILETALHVLQAPMLEKGLLKRAQDGLKRGAESAVEKGTQQGLGKLMESAAARIAELMSHLMS
jgi:hypothetical protein